MKTFIERIALFAACLAVAAVTGCDRSSDDGGTDASGVTHAGEPGDHDAAESADHVDIPPAVRNNLGLTFVTVERRRVESTLRVPGRFELLPTARREYRTMLPGRVELLVEQYDTIEPDQPLYRIDSPAWRDLQQELSEAESTLTLLEVKLETFPPLLAAHREHHRSLDESVKIWEERLAQIDAVREAGGGRMSEMAQVRAALATARAERSDVVEKDAVLHASQAETVAGLAAARTRGEFMLESAGALLDMPPAMLLEPTDTPDGTRSRWRTIDRIEVRADEAGTVESLGLTNGSWADEKSAVLTIVQPDRLRFHALGLQSDLGVLRDGLRARIVPPTPTRSGHAIDLQDTMKGDLALGLSGDPTDRTVDLYMTPKQLSSWARPGISAQLEIVTDMTETLELAIPLAAVQHDGLMPVIFLRERDDPDVAVRMLADLGVDDGRWVAVRSGLQDGDEIVLDGAFQLMLTTAGSTQQRGGHFHADGTFHEGED